MQLCNHGYFPTDCALCLKREGECDYASCERPATMVLQGVFESRPACADHAPKMIVA
jgi:hypothetical protein